MWYLKNFPGVIPPDPRLREGRGGEGKGKGGRGEGRGGLDPPTLKPWLRPCYKISRSKGKCDTFDTTVELFSACVRACVRGFACMRVHATRTNVASCRHKYDSIDTLSMRVSL
jgi:hypothetical protein